MRGVAFARRADGRLVVELDEWRSFTKPDARRKWHGYAKRVEHEAPVPLAGLEDADRAFLVNAKTPNRGRITMALDLLQLYGPEVDEALGVAEPAVDEWESGALVPSLEDVQRLATLTGFAVRFFYGTTPPAISGFICIRGRGGGCHWIESAGGTPGSVQLGLPLD